MSFEFTFTCPLPHGFHARPASNLAAVAKAFSAECSLTNQRNRLTADMKSVLSIIAADIRLDDPCSVRIQGPDEAVASSALQRFVQSDLAAHDAPLPDLASENQRKLPRTIRLAGVQTWVGQPASRGIGKGKAVHIGGIMRLPAQAIEAASHDPTVEGQRINYAVAVVRTRIQKNLLEHLSTAESGILQAHLAILGDPAFTARMLERVSKGDSAVQAIVDTNAYFGDKLRRSENPFLRERALDIHGICLELLESISGPGKPEPGESSVQLSQPSVVIAENLAPQQLLALERKWIRGLVMESAGTTSHTVILARSLAIPTVVGVKDAQRLTSGVEIIVDANRGFLILDGTPAVARFYEQEARIIERRKAVLEGYAKQPARLSDGSAIGLSVNVASREEVDAAFESGADGIGVFRTELLFLRREQPPAEEDQFEIYAHAARMADDRPVVIRTFDIGGDKPLRFVKLPAEQNPFLGFRGIRIYEQHQELLRTQLRAILRASALGRVHLMVPMVSTLDEVLWFKNQVAQVRRELEEKQITFDRTMPLGTMIEVPSSAFILDQLVSELAFFSLGTNDLSQYFFAADRGNPKVANLANVRHPAFLRFLRQIVDSVKTHGKSVSICGDMAADLRSIPLLIGLGFKEISVPVPDIPLVKQRISRHSLVECRRLVSEALACGTADEVERLLDRELAGAARSLLTRELVLIDNDVRSKEEAIRELVDAMYIEGRTDDPDRLEEAVWARESVYSTGLGHGFAVPHCKSDAVNAASIGILKLKNPVEWGAVDGNPVQLVIFLAARESDTENEHLRVFSRLARNLMDEEFRNRLLSCGGQDELLSVLNTIGSIQQLAISIQPADSLG